MQGRAPLLNFQSGRVIIAPGNCITAHPIIGECSPSRSRVLSLTFDSLGVVMNASQAPNDPLGPSPKTESRSGGDFRVTRRKGRDFTFA